MSYRLESFKKNISNYAPTIYYMYLCMYYYRYAHAKFKKKNPHKVENLGTTLYKSSIEPLKMFNQNIISKNFHS